MDVGARIKNARELKKITQEELGRICDTTKQTIFKYENGIITNIPVDRLLKIASVLEVSPAYLMGWENDEGTTDIGLSAIDIAKWAGVSIERAEAAIEIVNPSTITTDALNKIFSEITKNEPEIRAIQRAAKNMTSGDKQKMLAMLQIAFEEAFKDDECGKS